MSNGRFNPIDIPPPPWPSLPASPDWRQRIDEEIKAAGLKRQDIADQIGNTSRGSLSNVLNGISKTSDLVLPLSRAFGVELPQLARIVLYANQLLESDGEEALRPHADLLERVACLRPPPIKKMANDNE